MDHIAATSPEVHIITVACPVVVKAGSHIIAPIVSIVVIVCSRRDDRSDPSDLEH